MIPNQEAYDDIIKSAELDAESRQVFIDTVEYIEKCISQNKQFDISLYKIYITDIKGHTLPSLEQFYRIVLLLGLCGYDLNLSN